MDEATLLDCVDDILDCLKIQRKHIGARGLTVHIHFLNKADAQFVGRCLRNNSRFEEVTLRPNEDCFVLTADYVARHNRR